LATLTVANLRRPQKRTRSRRERPAPPPLATPGLDEGIRAFVGERAARFKAG
jgi:hypothetical protein